MNLVLQRQKEGINYENGDPQYMIKWNEMITYMNDMGYIAEKKKYKNKNNKYNQGILINGCQICKKQVFILMQNLKRDLRKPSNKIKLITCNYCNGFSRKTKGNRIEYFKKVNMNKAKQDRKVRKLKNIIESSISPELQCNTDTIEHILIDDKNFSLSENEEQYIKTKYLDPTQFSNELLQLLNE